MPKADTSQKREVYTTVPLEDGTNLATGDTIYIKGETGAEFKFQHLAVNPSGHKAVSCFGGAGGHGMWRAFDPKRVLVKKGRRAIRLAEFGDGLGESVAVLEAEPESHEGDIAKVTAAAVRATEAGEDFDMANASQRRRPGRATPTGALADAVAGGKVRAGTEINHGDHRAIITAEGFFDVNGERFASPSAAASHVLGGRAANGWVWWRLPDGTKLETVR